MEEREEEKQEQREREVTPVSTIDTWRFFLGYVARTPYFVATAIALIVMASICDIVIPIFAGKMIDAIALGHAEEGEQMRIALMALGGFVVFGLLHRAFFFSSELIWLKTITEKMHQLTIDAHGKVGKLSTDWHVNSFSGSTVRKITRGKWAFDTLNDAVFASLLPTLLVLIGITIVQFMYWPLMGLIFTIGFFIYIAISILMAIKYASPSNQSFNKNDSYFGGCLADSITCNAVVKAFGSENRENKLLDSRMNLWTELLKKVWFRFVLIGAIQDIYLSLLIGAIIGLAIWNWSKGLYSPGEVSFVMSSCFMIRGYVRNIGNTIRVIQKSLNELEDVVRFNKMILGVSDKKDALDLNVTKGGIVFNEVTFLYENQKKPTYDDFSLEIKPSEKIALIGHSGSGKSTFVKLLQRLYNIEDGSICIDGQNITDVTQASLRRALSIVPQEPMLFHRTLAENIAYGRPDATQEEIEDAARMAYAHNFIQELPEGYKTLVGERGIKLSGGERQRVAIARAILSDKPILILDEATSSLDSESESLIQKAIESLMEGRTTIMIAHRLSTIRQADRILVFDKGRIIEQGSHSELISKKNGKYRKLLEIQAAGFEVPI